MKEKRITLAHVAGGLTTGGVERVVYEYMSHMERSAYRLIYITYDKPDAQVKEKFEKLGFQVYEVAKKKEHFFRSCRQVYRILKDNQVDIVHSHMTLMCFITNIIGGLAGAPVRISHSHLVLYPKGIKKLVYGCFKVLSTVTATDLFACGPAAGEYLYGKEKCQQGKVHILYNAIDCEAFRFDGTAREKLRKKLGVGEKTVVLGNVGRFTPQKNQLFLLEVFKLYHEINPDSRLLLVGDGPMLAEVQEKSAMYGLSDCVVFTGGTTAVSGWYMAMDAFVFPSIYEGLGIAALEAQAAGLPVLASTEVPKEASQSSEMVFFPLEKGAMAWAEQLSLLKRPDRSRDIKKRFEECHLEIHSQAKELDAFYRKRLKERRG